jgi:hypothetical protein
MGVNLNLTMLPAKLKTANYATHQIGWSVINGEHHAISFLRQASGTLASTRLLIFRSTEVCCMKTFIIFGSRSKRIRFVIRIPERSHDPLLPALSAGLFLATVTLPRARHLELDAKRFWLQRHLL